MALPQDPGSEDNDCEWNGHCKEQPPLRSKNDFVMPFLIFFIAEE